MFPLSRLGRLVILSPLKVKLVIPLTQHYHFYDTKLEDRTAQGLVRS
ncbi:hypothetical protein [Rubritalea tangerina]